MTRLKALLGAILVLATGSMFSVPITAAQDGNDFTGTWVAVHDVNGLVLPHFEVLRIGSDGEDDLVVLSNVHGAFLKGFAHESAATSIPSRIFYRDLPAEFEQCAREPAFMAENVTFCIWRLVDQPHWSRSEAIKFDDVDDGSTEILSMFDGAPCTSRAWARKYYEHDVPMEAIESVYQHRAPTEELVAALNPQQSLERLRSDIVGIG